MSEYKKTTVVFPIQNDQILLGMKKRGFGQGWWNGFGGKLEPGETYPASAVRETSEEVGLTIKEQDLTLAVEIVFRFDSKVDVVSKAYITNNFTGEPVETDEMNPKWFPITQIPYDTMWPGDDQWIPKIFGDISQPLAFIIDFTGDNQFISIKETDSESIKEYF